MFLSVHSRGNPIGIHIAIPLNGRANRHTAALCDAHCSTGHDKRRAGVLCAQDSWQNLCDPSRSVWLCTSVVGRTVLVGTGWIGRVGKHRSETTHSDQEVDIPIIITRSSSTSYRLEERTNERVLLNQVTQHTLRKILVSSSGITPTMRFVLDRCDEKRSEECRHRQSHHHHHEQQHQQGQ